MPLPLQETVIRMMKDPDTFLGYRRFRDVLSTQDFCRLYIALTFEHGKRHAAKKGLQEAEVVEPLRQKFWSILLKPKRTGRIFWEWVQPVRPSSSRTRKSTKRRPLLLKEALPFCSSPSRGRGKMAKLRKIVENSASFWLTPETFHHRPQRSIATQTLILPGNGFSFLSRGEDSDASVTA